MFVDIDAGSTIAQEEIFGPVLPIVPYDEDAIRIANGTIYGLSVGEEGFDEMMEPKSLTTPA